MILELRHNLLIKLGRFSFHFLNFDILISSLYERGLSEGLKSALHWFRLFIHLIQQ